VQEYLDLGIHGWAMSRFSGCAVAFKALADTVESSASVDADPFRVEKCRTTSSCRKAA
jgi:indolepyruvate ferredoxin oxidoreductase